MRPRSLARRLALQYLHGVDLLGQDLAEPIGTFLAEHGEDRASRSFAAELVGEILQDLSRIDALIGEAARNWRLERMAVVERNILRIGTVELLTKKTPARVVIDEAVRMAKKFGSKESGGFVNGILDGIAQELGLAVDPAPLDGVEEGGDDD